jgi:hypothetical protein
MKPGLDLKLFKNEIIDILKDWHKVETVYLYDNGFYIIEKIDLLCGTTLIEITKDEAVKILKSGQLFSVKLFGDNSPIRVPEGLPSCKGVFFNLENGVSFPDFIKLILGVNRIKLLNSAVSMN